MMNQSVLEETIRIYKLLSNSTRVRILFLLNQREMSVSEMTETLSLEQSNLSHQLKMLREHQLITQKRVGKQMIYTLDDPHIMQLLEQTASHAAHVVEGKKYEK
jgi:DNA-binding transcriptional ArsR family regulator